MKRDNYDKVRLNGAKYPFKLRKNTSDFDTFWELFMLTEYEVDYPPKANTIIDCGSNIGLFAILVKRLYPDAKLVCIEPDPENFETLEENLKRYKNTFFEQAGVWSRPTVLKVYDKHELGKWAMVVEEDEVNGKIPAISIQSIMEKYSIDQIDILKIDIETSEKELFSKNYETWLPKVKMIIIELHDRFLEGCSEVFFEAINKSIKNYKHYTNGQNTVIVNNDLN